MLSITPMAQENYRWVPNELKKYRKITGLSQKDVAKLLGFKNTSRISLWEKGVGMPNLLNVAKLSSIYSVLVDTLFIELFRVVRKDVKEQRKKYVTDKT